MRVLVTGASGLIGSALSAALRSRGDAVVRLARGRDDDRGSDSAGGAGAVRRWDPASGSIDPSIFDGIDAVVHLAGEPIAAGRWTQSRRTALRTSRVEGTTALAEGIARLGAESRPKVLLSASAVGWYGDRGDEVLAESSAPGGDFLATLCRAWEAATLPAREAGVRVAIIRTGLVLSTEGGALAPMLRVGRLGLLGPVGSGEQWMSWIHIDDEVALMLRLLEDATLEGPFNATAPNPVRNRAFVTELGHALRRPAILPMPAFAVRLLFGAMGDALLLSGQRVEPRRALDAGFAFRYATLPAALAALLRRGRDRSKD
ncbi:MAG TPA: TIGR01777 family oxidoreductase [Phycisphaerales bacterium]|nr:TIGR01777 family oxidoreductase [Phycisphaerales bacterium]HMP36538.1 TIGR01777 family oxidoreductase [Phycisphaerales bacterium]